MHAVLLVRAPRFNQHSADRRGTIAAGERMRAHADNGELINASATHVLGLPRGW